MKTYYIGTKIIQAVPGKLVNGCMWPDGLPLPEEAPVVQDQNEDEKNCRTHIEEGYFFPQDDNRYVQFLPKDEFEKIFRPAEFMDFGLALEAVKQGKRIARKGWNGKGMFLYYVPAAAYPPSTDVAKAAFGGENVPYGAYIAMKTAQGNVVPWLASQTDMLAVDWYIVD